MDIKLRIGRPIGVRLGDEKEPIFQHVSATLTNGQDENQLQTKTFQMVLE
jgi:hypothetical protein